MECRDIWTRYNTERFLRGVNKKEDDLLFDAAVERREKEWFLSLMGFSVVPKVAVDALRGLQKLQAHHVVAHVVRTRVRVHYCCTLEGNGSLYLTVR